MSFRSILSAFVLPGLASLAMAPPASSASADERSTVAELQAKARLQQTWLNPEWLNLLHYDGDGSEAGSYESQVNDEQFFLAADGRRNPESELLATIASLYATDTAGDEHAQCRFIARFKWLSRNLTIDPDTLPSVHCSAYVEWRKHVRSGSVTMVFPAYHLNSPSSMFGHTLLRLDSATDEGNARWLSTAVNFGANATEDDNSILYAYKGLAGGYSGLFITDHYYKKIQEYSRIEHRDIWEYQLNLAPDEIERIIAHLWELQGINFDYYYFDENCSYRLLELLEIARPGVDLTDRFKVTAIPVDTVRAVDEAGMIESTAYRPSQATVLRHALRQLPAEEQSLVMALSSSMDASKQAPFTELSEDKRRVIVDLAYQYLRYRQSGLDRDAKIARHSHQLLLLLNSYPKAAATNADIETPPSPEQGHGSKRATIALGQRHDRNYAELGFRMSFHDLEDNENGFLRGAQINIGSIQVHAQEDDALVLYRLDLVDIFSITPRTRFFKPLSWKVYTGFERQFTHGVDQLTYHLTGGAGGSWQLFSSGQAYALATARLEINEQLDRAIEPAVGFSAGILQLFGWTTARLDLGGEQFSDGIYRLRAGYIQNFVISTNHSLRVSASYEWQEADEFSNIQLGYQYYF